MGAQTQNISRQSSSRLTKRQARFLARRQEARSNRIRAVALWVGIGVVAVTIIGLLIISQGSKPQSEQLGQFIANLGNQHIEAPAKGTYNSTPPTSGPHYENLAPWGISAEPIQNELQVHNLEDGGVMVQYNCPEGCADLVLKLADIVRRYPVQVALAPYPDMDARIALTAWTRLDTFDEFDEQRIVKFIEAYRGIDHHVGGG